VGQSESPKWCSERLVTYKLPQYKELRDMLPKSKVGNFLRRELRNEEKRKVDKE
jgi:long-chain acyl-CoA synthetase